MKKLLFIFFIASGLFVSCVENPEEKPTPLPPPGNLSATFDNQNFQSVTTVTVIDAVSMSLKATSADGSYFKITLPENPLLGTYTWDVFDAGVTGFSLEYNEGIGTDSYIAARDDAGAFANFPTYTDNAQLVILGIDRFNKRISGRFMFTGVRFTDDTQTAIETKEFNYGNFFDIPYTATAVVEPVDENSILPSKIIDSYPGQNIEDQTSIFTYLGKKIVKEVNTDSGGLLETTRYTYTNNLISKIEIETDGIVDSREIFEYNNNKLVSYTSFDIIGEIAIKENYVHNLDGSISVVRFTGDLTTQDIPDGTSTVRFNADGEVSQIVFSSGLTKNYTYDNKNYVFKNVIGFDKISFVDGEATGISRNITSEIEGGLPNYDFQFTYTTAGFPLKSTDIGVEVNFFY